MITPGNDGGSGDLPDCELKDGFILDDQPPSIFLQEQSICPLPWTLLANNQSDLATKVSPILFSTCTVLTCLTSSSVTHLRGLLEEEEAAISCTKQEGKVETMTVQS